MHAEVVPINRTSRTPRNLRVANALAAPHPSVRLQAASAAGSDPDADVLEGLVERCAVEPDFLVRDMLSWALSRLSPDITLRRIRQDWSPKSPRPLGPIVPTLAMVVRFSRRCRTTRASPVQPHSHRPGGDAGGDTPAFADRPSRL